MEDRLKFRVYDKNTGLYLGLDENKKIYNIGSSTLKMCLLKEDQFVIEQCIGLEDKNEKLIFDGDVCIGKNRKKTKIIFKEGSFRHELLNAKHDSSISIMWIDMFGIEIIGTIHDKESNA